MEQSIDDRMKEAKAQYNTQIRELEDERLRLEVAASPNRELATYIHETFCTWNHTDGCAWFYGSWENPRWEHGQWLKKAEELMEALELIFPNVILTPTQIHSLASTFKVTLRG